MFMEEDCLCPLCEYMRKLPVPRNRSERREQEKMIRKDLKPRHEVHMVWTPFDYTPDETIEDEDDDFDDELELDDFDDLCLEDEDAK